MLPSLKQLRATLLSIVDNKQAQGHIIEGLKEQVQALPDSYDAMVAMANRLATLPMRPDWPYAEPNALDEIWAECDASRPTRPIASVDPHQIAPRVETAFLSSVCGCILGKPLEFNPDLQRIRAAAESIGEWPLRDYIPEKLLEAIGRRHRSWPETVRERIQFAAPDDDLNYTIAGMLLLERHGINFTKKDVSFLWFDNMPAHWQWGPERTMNINNALWWQVLEPAEPWETWASVLNPGDELCGAVIRADAYGYACPGRPALAAELAWRDASFSHRRTGIYGTMFIAAAIATAFVADDPMDIFTTAAKFVPQRSRFAEVVRDSIEMVRQSGDWLEGYGKVHNKYKKYQHCQVYQEVGTVINTLRFAKDIGDGICIQVSQGNDTDSFGATCGSILGAYFGPGRLEERWLKPFNDTIHTTLGNFHEQRLSAVANRMSRLPAIAAQQAGGAAQA